jgi:hypothetical protein
MTLTCGKDDNDMRRRLNEHAEKMTLTCEKMTLTYRKMFHNRMAIKSS